MSAQTDFGLCETAQGKAGIRHSSMKILEKRLCWLSLIVIFSDVIIIRLTARKITTRGANKVLSLYPTVKKIK